MTTGPVELPVPLFQLLREGAPAILATQGGDGWAHLVMTWAAAKDRQTVRFGADVGSTTEANLQREGKAALQVIGRDNILFLLKGTTRTVKGQIEASPFPVAMVELDLREAEDQSWPGVMVAPLTYQWTGADAADAAAAERAVLAELRDWEPGSR